MTVMLRSSVRATNIHSIRYHQVYNDHVNYMQLKPSEIKV